MIRPTRWKPYFRRVLEGATIVVRYRGSNSAYSCDAAARAAANMAIMRGDDKWGASFKLRERSDGGPEISRGIL